jgi:hypothetical protein
LKKIIQCAAANDFGDGDQKNMANNYIDVSILTASCSACPAEKVTNSLFS